MLLICKCTKTAALVLYDIAVFLCTQYWLPEKIKLLCKKFTIILNPLKMLISWPAPNIIKFEIKVAIQNPISSQII